MNGRNLNDKIVNFKKKYTELLMQLDNSALLNLSKFENIENFQGTENLFSLLKENEQVSKNLQLIKESINKKIVNLQLLSSKTGNEELEKAYENLYDFNALDIDESSHFYPYQLSKKEIKQITDDIDNAMQKIDEITSFIQETVIPKMDKDEEENKKLVSLLNKSQKKIENLLIEKDIDQQTISNLYSTNLEWETEYNKVLDSWVGLNQKLVDLEVYINQNEEVTKEISAEKDRIIEQLEKKINELLSDLDSTDVFSFSENRDVWKITDSFVNLINRIFTETFKIVYKFENDYQAKIKDFNRNKDSLIKEFKDSVNRNDLSQAMISSLSEKDEVDVYRDETIEFVKKISLVNSVEKFQNFLNNNFFNSLQYISFVVQDLLSAVNECIARNQVYFSKRSSRRMNSFVVQISGYIEKVEIFKNQVLTFIERINLFSDKVSFSMINFSPYWSDAAYGFKHIYMTFHKDLVLIKKLVDLFIVYFSFESKKNNGVNFEKEFDKVLEKNISNPKYSNYIQNPYEINDNETINDNFEEFSPIENYQDFYYEDSAPFENQSYVPKDQIGLEEILQENQETYYKYDYSDSAEESRNEEIESINNSESNFDSFDDKLYGEDNFENFVDNLEKEEMFLDSESEIKPIEEFSQKINGLENLDNDLLNIPTKELSFELNKQIKDFDSFVKKIMSELQYSPNLSENQKEITKKELSQILVNETTTIKEKLEKIENLLVKVFGENYYNQSFHYW
ncbi:MAG: DUF3450 domain-containing protein, partial [Malacoplasma sp.]|nr:DUF3450 domain-containing protein [Malacoplasma sp.]